MNARTGNNSAFTYKRRVMARMQSIRNERMSEGDAPAKIRNKKDMVRITIFISFLPKKKAEKKCAIPPIIARCIPDNAST